MPTLYPKPKQLTAKQTEVHVSPRYPISPQEVEKEARLEAKAIVEAKEAEARQHFEEKLRLKAKEKPATNILEWEKQTREAFEQQLSEWKTQTEEQLTKQIIAERHRSALWRSFLAGTGALSFGLAPTAATVGAGSSIAVSQTIKGLTRWQWLTPEEAFEAGALGAASGVASAAITKYIIAPKASEWLTQRYLAHHEVASKVAVELGPTKGLTEWRTWADKLVMRFTGAKPYLAPGEVSIPVGETVGPRGFEVLPHTLPYTDIGWELTFAPKMGGVMIPKYPTFTETAMAISPTVAATLSAGELKALKQMLREEPMPEDWLKGFTRKSTATHKPEEYIPKVGSFERRYIYAEPRSGKLFFQRGYGKMPELQELMREMKLLPFTTQTQVTRLGIHPYIPKLGLDIPITEAAMLPSGLTAGLTGAFSILKTGKAGLPSFKFKLETPSRLERKTAPFLKSFQWNIPGISEFEKAAPAVSPKVSPAVSPVTEAAQTTKQMAHTLQRTVQTRKLPRPERMFKLSIPGMERRRRGLGVGWFRWDYPILSPEKLLKGFGLNIGLARARRRRK